MSQIYKSLPFSNYKDEQHKTVVAVWYAGILIDEMMGRALTPFKISVEQFRIMRVLQTIYPATIPVYNIGHYIHVRSDVSRTITQLSQRGLVEKLTMDNDKRLVPVRLTPSGNELIEDAVETIYGDLMSPPLLPEDIAANTTVVLEQLIKAFEKQLKKNP